MNDLVHVGVDLAWSTRARTGVAVVGEAGALLDSATLRTDEEILGWIERPGWAPVTAAVDAPLIVANASGQRPCERMISSAFGRYGASCHASNLAISYFNPPRGAVLAQRLGWRLDPGRVGSVAAPACIEVYPHPAMVSLFALESVLPYKAKAGRPLEVRRPVFVTLMDHMEGLEPLALGSSARWSALRSRVEGSTRQVDLEVVEDEIDAIFCAYLAWLWHHDRDVLRVYGDTATGYIVAPPPPPNPQAGGPNSRVSTPRAFSVTFEVVERPATFAISYEASWRAAVTAAAAVAMTGRAIPGPQTRFAVEISYRLATPRTVSEQWGLDSLVKPTIDALTPILGLRPGGGPPEADGERVDEIHATKRPSGEGEDPGARITVRALTAGDPGTQA